MDTNTKQKVSIEKKIRLRIKRSIWQKYSKTKINVSTSMNFFFLYVRMNGRINKSISESVIRTFDAKYNCLLMLSVVADGRDRFMNSVAANDWK